LREIYECLLTRLKDYFGERRNAITS